MINISDIKHISAADRHKAADAIQAWASTATVGEQRALIGALTQTVAEGDAVNAAAARKKTAIANISAARQTFWAKICSDLTRRDIYALMDTMSATPVVANYMLTMLRTLIEYGVPRGYVDSNPAVGIKRIKVEDFGHSPWPEDGYAYVLKHAPTHLPRMAILGRATGQRVSDLVKMKPAHLADDGVALRIGKLKDRPHLVPLTKSQMEENSIVGGSRSGIRYLDYENRQRIYHKLFESALERMARCDADPRPQMSIHGLRATAILDRRSAGTEDGAIADEIGMSVHMVSRYLRFADRTASARASRDRRERKQAGFENLAEIVN